jgi:DNA helicase HerA-like ATPase
VSRRQERIADALVRFLEDPWEVLGEFLGWVPAAVRLLVAAAAAALVALIVAAAWRAWRDRRLIRNARRIRILPPGEADPSGAATLWMGLHALLRPWWRRVLWGQPHLAWEITARPEEVEVSVWVPRSVPPGLVERAVEASWPGARTEPVQSDHLEELFGSGKAETTELALGEREWFPIGTTSGSDPLNLGLASLTGLAEGEGAAVQVLARPATSAARRRLLRAARNLRAGTRFAWRAGRASSVRRPPPDPWIEGDVRAVLAKASSPLWWCLVRVAVASPVREQARGRIHALAGAFALFEGRNGFRRRRIRRGTRRMGSRLLSRSYLLSVTELAQVASLPAAGSVPGLERATSRTVAPPRALPAEGKVLGKADHPGTGRAVAISVGDARHHLHVIGETGTGKSTLLANLVLEDVRAGRSAVVIDPKGDLVEAILERLPPGAEERTCLIDPDDKRRAVGLNVLEGEDRDLVVDHVAGVFERIYERWWGPRTDDIMRHACLTLTQVPGATLAEITELLINFEWRRALQDRLTDVVGVRPFWRWYESLHHQQRNQSIAPLLNKLRAFTLPGPVRSIIGQARSKLDIAAHLDSGGLLLVRVPKGTIGEKTSRLLGALIIARVWQAAMKRASRPEEDRPDTALYVDEVHNYLVLPRSFEDLLAEARGYRLSLVLAHQHLGQLPRDVRDALGANARTKVVFACSPEDAFHLARHFGPGLDDGDLSHLAGFQAACRPCVAGAQAQAFTLRTLPLPEGFLDRAAEVRERSAELFATPRPEVETGITNRHLNLTALLPPARAVGAQPADHSSEHPTEQSGGQP